jgi:hypothetical protein
MILLNLHDFVQVHARTISLDTLAQPACMTERTGRCPSACPPLTTLTLEASHG